MAIWKKREPNPPSGPSPADNDARKATLHSRLFDAIQQAVIATDADSRIIFWNPFAETLYGWSAEEVFGRNILDVVPAEPLAASPVLKAVEAGDTWAGEFLVRRKSGETFEAYVTTSTMRDEAGNPCGAVGVSYDITVQKQRDQRYQTLFKAMSEGFALCEAIRDDAGALIDYCVVEINPVLQALLGGGDLVGGRLSDSNLGGKAWLALCDGVLRTGEPARFEFHNALNDQWHEIRVNRVTPNVMAQFFFDITERKAAQTRQAELFDELNHRVKNNLTIVAGLLTMQARDAGPRVRSELMKAVGRVQSISDVHDSLNKGHGAESVDFGDYLSALGQRLSASLLVDDRVSIEVDAQPLAVSVDHAVPLGMIVNELVTNAVKYAYPAPDRGVISVRFAREADGALLSVGDQGRGLPPDFKAAAGGLGMKLIDSLVRQVGGALTISRDAGLRFEIRLPT